MAAKFWMVLGTSEPVYKHATEEMARKEAERLARLNPRIPFTVLESVAVCMKSDVSWRDCDGQEIDIPF